ncbi:MAG: type III-B CRISPR module-associated protein Cmr5 [Gammaproteobacteria bacterium]|nr:MAG: type III-B CRISPR module-associated protein Cmr5 [Gammaproteobacteria bacterium]
MSLTTRNKLEQGRAAMAYRYAEEGARLSKKKEYKSYVKKMPMMIKVNGLGAAVAFAFSKGAKNGEPSKDTPWGLIYHQLAEWVSTEKQLVSLGQKSFANALTELDSAQYRAVTNEVLALLNWMRRFSEGLIEGESEDI